MLTLLFPFQWPKRDWDWECPATLPCTFLDGKCGNLVSYSFQIFIFPCLYIQFLQLTRWDLDRVEELLPCPRRRFNDINGQTNVALSTNKPRLPTSETTLPPPPKPLYVLWAAVWFWMCAQFRCQLATLLKAWERQHLVQ